MNSKTTARCLVILAILAGLGTACTARPSTPPPEATLTLRSDTLVPYQTRTATIDLSALARLAPTATPTPSATPTLTPSPTPRSYVIKAGDDMSGIALRYRVKLEDLKTANPSANPRLLKIGSTLIIPGTAPAAAGTPLPPRGSPTATPPPVLLGPVRCLPGAGGATCFVLAANRLESALEGLNVVIRLLDGGGKTIASQAAVSPLDLLKAGAALPLAAYFPPPLPEKFQAAAELVAVLPAAEGARRYIELSLENTQITILPGGLAAEVNGEVLSKGDQPAGRVWTAAVAYDAAGLVLGVRRWESSQNLAAGGRLPFSLRVYSAGGPIDHVELLAEAAP